MDLTYLFILALAVSIDSFGVGVTYGFKKVKIPLTSVYIISLASALTILLSMHIGGWISLFLSPTIAKWIGSIILIILGVWIIIQVLFQSNKEDNTYNEAKKKDDNLISIELKKLGLVIQILRTPMKADLDQSGRISSIEAIFLGLALSLDAFGAGLGASLIGFKPLVTASVIAGMSGIFILIGIRLGFVFSEISWLKKFTIFPGVIMVLIGILKII
ncbi:MAG: sporulation membrane protein YtaF [Vulcanibacillus sp.]